LSEERKEALIGCAIALDSCDYLNENISYLQDEVLQMRIPALQMRIPVIGEFAFFSHDLDATETQWSINSAPKCHKSYLMGGKQLLRRDVG
jgi:hypothetical protein